MILTDDDIDKIRNVFLDELEKGLSEQPSSLQMENTYIPELPSGSGEYLQVFNIHFSSFYFIYLSLSLSVLENGKFLAVDLGGTNFRVLLVEFLDGVLIDSSVKNYNIEENLRLGSGTDLFDYIAHCVQDFLIEKQLNDYEITLGTFFKLFFPPFSLFDMRTKLYYRFYVFLSDEATFSLFWSFGQLDKII